MPLQHLQGETIKEKILFMGQMGIDAYLELARAHGFLHVSSPGTLMLLPTGWLCATCVIDQGRVSEGLRWSFTTAETQKDECDAIVAGLDMLISEFGADDAASALKDSLEAH